MGAAQRQIGHNWQEWAGSGTFYSDLANLRASIQAGNTVYASDINKIATLINNMNGHYHNYTDLYQTATFGNTGDRNTYTEGKNTNGIDDIRTVGTSTATNTEITAARHNELRDAINVLRVHYHGINDRTG